MDIESDDPMITQGNICVNGHRPIEILIDNRVWGQIMKMLLTRNRVQVFINPRNQW